jgi:hypothetical protein
MSVPNGEKRDQRGTKHLWYYYRTELEYGGINVIITDG